MLSERQKKRIIKQRIALAEERTGLSWNQIRRIGQMYLEILLKQEALK